jgi:hypothetical protein
LPKTVQLKLEVVQVMDLRKGDSEKIIDRILDYVVTKVLHEHVIDVCNE